jgi:hypothetical protein
LRGVSGAAGLEVLLAVAVGAAIGELETGFGGVVDLAAVVAGEGANVLGVLELVDGLATWAVVEDLQQVLALRDAEAIDVVFHAGDLVKGESAVMTR